MQNNNKKQPFSQYLLWICAIKIHVSNEPSPLTITVTGNEAHIY